MNLVIKSYYIHESQALSPVRTPQNSIFGSHLHYSSHSSFPIIAVAVIGILATAFLLVSYYVFVIKCCLNWHRLDLLRRFSFSSSQHRDHPLTAHSPDTQNRGLDESVIRSIPIFQFKKEEKEKIVQRSFRECAVCLNEFQEGEKLRIIPNCSHLFHIDCIDVWLQNNANCPLCRTTISSTTRFPPNGAITPSSSSQDPNPYAHNLMGRDEDFVVIELGEQDDADQSLLTLQERLNSGEISARSLSPSPGKSEQKIGQKKMKKFKHLPSMGDECIDVREKDEQFAIQPIRRSFSMDSAADRQLYAAVQEFVQQNRHVSEANSADGCCSRVRRSFFSFGNGRGTRCTVLPVQLEP